MKRDNSGTSTTNTSQSHFKKEMVPSINMQIVVSDDQWFQTVHTCSIEYKSPKFKETKLKVGLHQNTGIPIITRTAVKPYQWEKRLPSRPNEKQRTSDITPHREQKLLLITTYFSQGCYFIATRHVHSWVLNNPTHIQSHYHLQYINTRPLLRRTTFPVNKKLWTMFHSTTMIPVQDSWGVLVLSLADCYY